MTTVMADHQMKIKHARPKIQRKFLSWFSESRHLFSTPLSISKHTKKLIELKFTDAESLIRVTLTSWEINVSFHWKDTFWDFLICFEAIPELKRGYYVCSLCDDAERDFYISREVLWQLHLFEPFLEWVNNKLTIAPWIEVDGQEGESTFAKLVGSSEQFNRLMSYQSNGSLIIANPLYLK